MPFGRTLLLIDHDPAFRRYAVHVLSGLGFEVAESGLGRAGLNELARVTPECVLLDLSLPDLKGSDVLRAIAAAPAPQPPVVIVAGALEVEEAVELMKLGAKDVVTKPVDAERLRRAVVTAIEKSDLAKDVARIQALLPDGFGADLLVAESPAMRSALERVERLAAVDMPVLILGEKGAGKGVVARYLHAVGPRAGKPFVHVPGGDAPGVAEQALFGMGGRPSAFAQAQDGVVYIESITSLGSSGQERLARVLAELSAARAGGHMVSCPRVIVGATREIALDVEAGRVKEDLARRLSPLTVHVPPARERSKDVPEIVRRIVTRIAREEGRAQVVISDEVMRQFSEHAWPGNLVELEAAVIRAVVLARDGQVRLADLGGGDASGAASSPRGPGWSPTVNEAGSVLRFDEYEAEIFRFALRQAGGCVSRAAEMLGVGRATMYRKMRSYEIDAPPVAERGIIRSGRRPKSGDGEAPHAA
jgi:DNA-binding NtrC family response regulator